MDYIKSRIKKYTDLYKQFGFPGVFNAAKEFISRRRLKRSKKVSVLPVGNVNKDILFISGCPGAPKRYRCEFPLEQLENHQMSGDIIDVEDFSEKIVNNYQSFIFFRTPYSEKLEHIILKIKQQNKFLAYDIDDNIFDLALANQLEEVQRMSAYEKDHFLKGVEDHKKCMKLFDYGITTTESLKKDMESIIPTVLLNRNFPGKILQKLHAQVVKKDTSKVSIGYFSGSYTHNKDFAMIQDVLFETLEKYTETELWVTGFIDLPEEIPASVKNRVIKKPFLDWQEFPHLVSAIDINLAPLVNTRFNQGKSEIKFLEAALSKVPTIASKLPAFEFGIEDGVNGFLAKSTDEWESKLSLLITDKELRERIGNKAKESIFEMYEEIYSGQRLLQFIKANWIASEWWYS